MTTRQQTASERITEKVTSWLGVEAGIGARGEFGFTVGGREIGHLHGDHAAHFGFPKRVWAELLEQGRVERHPIDRPGWAARRIEDEQDVREVIELIRVNYERAVARHGLPPESSEPRPVAGSMDTESGSDEFRDVRKS